MIAVANAPCSWGIIENIEGDRGGYAQVLDEIQLSGYGGTELGDWGFMPTEPAALQSELAARNLKLLASWVTVQLHNAARHTEDEAAVLRTARLLAEVGGPQTLIVLGNDPYTDPLRTQVSGRVQPDQVLSDEGWAVLAAGANRLAHAVRNETGLRTVFHHHVGTWVETPAETERLLAMTDPDALGLCFDTGHWRFSGGEVLAGLRQHADRIWHVHFKDCHPDVAAESRRQEWDGPRSVGEGVFCELSQGEIDFAAVLAELKAIGYEGWIVVEQDVLPGMGTPLDSAKRNRAYLQSIGL